MWIYRFTTIEEITTSSLILASYYMTGIFVSLYLFSKEEKIRCTGGLFLGLTGTTLSIIGCCSPIIYILFIVGVIGSAIVPYLSIIPVLGIVFLLISILSLAYRIEMNIRMKRSFVVS
jgi:hypothetical protein